MGKEAGEVALGQPPGHGVLGDGGENEPVSTLQEVDTLLLFAVIMEAVALGCVPAIILWRGAGRPQGTIVAESTIYLSAGCVPPLEIFTWWHVLPSFRRDPPANPCDRSDAV